MKPGLSVLSLEKDQHLISKAFLPKVQRLASVCFLQCCSSSSGSNLRSVSADLLNIIRQSCKAFRQAERTSKDTFQRGRRGTDTQTTDRTVQEIFTEKKNKKTDLVCEYPGFLLRHHPYPQLVFHSHESSWKTRKRGRKKE